MSHKKLWSWLVSFSVSASNLLQWGERKEEMREKQWNEGGIGEKNGLEGKGGKCDFMQ